MRHMFSPCARPTTAAAGLAIALFLVATLAPPAADGSTSGVGSNFRYADASAACGGVTGYKPDGAAWQCTFDDEFSGSTLNTTAWTPQLTATSNFTTGPSGAKACYVDTPNNISVANGELDLTVRKESAPFTCGSGRKAFTTQYTSGEVSTYLGFHQQNGKFEIRARLPQTTVKGLQESLWLWPVNPTKYGAWPSSGEIDVAEFYSQYPTLAVPYIHYVYYPWTTNAATQTNVVTAYNCSINFSAFNTYAAIWQPGRIEILVNGQTCLVDKYKAALLAPPAPFDQPFLIALTQALGVQGNAFDPTLTPLPATLQIDYVRVWK